MNCVDIKTEIQKTVDQLPEDALADILEYLRQLQKLPAENIKLALYLKKTLSEDKELLERLAG